MPAPVSIEAFLDLGYKSGLLENTAVEAYRRNLPQDDGSVESPRKFADALVRDGLLTQFQADTLLAGKWRGFVINDKYRLLQKVGAGGMGSIYLCEHKHLRRRLALKVLPVHLARDADAVERFRREATALFDLNHPNVVRFYDVDHDAEMDIHFIVLEFIDGSNLHDIVRRHGPMSIVRAAHYIRQAALGLQHAHEAGLVHRDIKPGNLLLDRNGVVKILDMGLAWFFGEEEENLSQDQEVGNVLGTADYLAPEQVQDSRVDIRADIYSLGVTFYYLLSGKSPFSQGTVSQKLIWHQVRQPKPIRGVRPEVPQELAAVLEKMMAKNASDRFATPAEAALALNTWTQTAIPPPPEEEMPPLCPGQRGSLSGSGSNNTPISRGAPSPLGLRGSPATPVSRGPRLTAPRTNMRMPAAESALPPHPAGAASPPVTAAQSPPPVAVSAVPMPAAASPEEAIAVRAELPPSKAKPESAPAAPRQPPPRPATVSAARTQTTGVKQSPMPPAPRPADTHKDISPAVAAKPGRVRDAGNYSIAIGAAILVIGLVALLWALL